MKKQVKFIKGYDCINFPCKASKPCTKENTHGKHSMGILFLLSGDLGAVQFKLSTGWMPFYSPKDRIGYREIPKNEISDLYPMPTDLGYHSYKPRYEDQTSMGKCDVLGGAECFYDGSGLNCNDAYYALVNGGEDALWEFLEGYYKSVFEDSEYPEPREYTDEVKVPHENKA